MLGWGPSFTTKLSVHSYLVGSLLTEWDPLQSNENGEYLVDG
jgi:hypothetical protein